MSTPKEEERKSRKEMLSHRGEIWSDTEYESIDEDANQANNCPMVDSKVEER